MDNNLNNEQYIDRYKQFYWSYYLALEDRLAQTEKFVSFDKENGKTFSTEYLALLQMACSEIDVIGKEIGNHFSGVDFGKTDGILKWGYYLLLVFPELTATKVLFKKTKEEIVPFEGWGLEMVPDASGKNRYVLKAGCKTPSWWSDYNRVKHERTSGLNYQKANLKNALFAICGLYLLNRLMMRKLDINLYSDLDGSTLFRICGFNDERSVTFGVDDAGYVSAIYHNEK